MKKIISLVLCLATIFSIIALCACNNKVETTAKVETEATTEKTTETTLIETTEVTTEEETTESTEEETTETTKEEEVVVPTKKTLKLLAIGNSYSQDTTAYVYNIAKEMGYERVILVNLYYPGCPLELHVNYIYSKAYDYEYNSTGTWVKKGKVCINDVIGTEDWDVITLQQKSGYSGDPNTYEPYLTTLLEYLEEKAPNAKIYWNMTWAYQANSTESTFTKYNKNQMTMYNAIISTVQSKVLTKESIDGVIPVGTAVQNMRTSFYGDNLFRDSLHLNYGVGRYLAALMWMKELSGGLSIDNVKWVPDTYDFNEKELLAIKESVNNAYLNPYEITESKYQEGTTFADILEKYNIDESKYKKLDLEITLNSYYNSMSSSTRVDKSNSTASNITQFASTNMLQKSDIPKGSLIIILDKYQYRPEGWATLSSKNSSSNRPGNITANVVVVDDAWWGSYNYRAFNIAKEGNPNLTSTEMEKLKNVFEILVPIDPNTVPPVIKPEEDETGADLEAILKKAGYNLSDYKVLNYSVEFYAYYNSTSNSSMVAKSKGSTATNINQFAAVNQFFTKEDLPYGTLIVILSGYQYRPEGWTSLSVKTSNRPVNVQKEVVEVDASWWGSFNYRSFNISKVNNPGLSDTEMKKLDKVLFILVPNGK